MRITSTASSASSPTQYCVTPSAREAEYVAMSHEAKSASAIKTVLDFVQPHLSGRAIDMYEDKERAKALAENPQGSYCSKHVDVRFYFFAGVFDVEAGNNSQCGLGGTTCRHPYETTRARGAPEAP